jgi:uncharacterized protein (TIGR03067 family)
VGRPKEFKGGQGIALFTLERVKDEKEELAALAGEWKVKTMNVSGQDDPAKQVGSTTWAVEGAKVMMLERDAPSPIIGLTLDPAAIPPAIDLTSTDGKPTKLKGIYFRQGDRLTIAFRDPQITKTDRPTELKPGGDVTFIVLERVPKK